MIRAGLGAVLLAAAAPAAAPQTAPAPPVETAPLPTHYFPAEADAAAQMAAAIAEAKAGGRTAILVFGADWCGDSTALAAVLRSDLFAAQLGRRYSVTLIDVAHPLDGKGRNLELIRSLGVPAMTGTPEVLVIGRHGTPLNSADDAHAWHDAGNRGVRAVLKYFRVLKAD